VFAYAAARTKLGLDAGLKLGAENHVFWGGREGLLNFYKFSSNLYIA